MDDMIARDLADQLKQLGFIVRDLTETIGSKYAALTNEEIEQPEGYLGSTRSYFSDTPSKPPTFAEELRILLNKHGMEKYSNTPDWVLTEFLLTSLRGFDLGIKMRESTDV